MWLDGLVIHLQDEVHLDEVGHGEVPHPGDIMPSFSISPKISPYRQISENPDFPGP